MRVLVTGATGFVGRWLTRELVAHGHDPIAAPGSAVLDVTDAKAVAEFISVVRPEAVAHLAGISHAHDASRDPDRAFAVNAGGTRAVIDAIGALTGPIPVLVAGSAEVYGRPDPADLPLKESAPLRTDDPYGRSKLAQERVALERAAVLGVPVCVTRSFNHAGPGQRPDFVAPALARRVLEAKRSHSETVAVGNLDVRRDLGDVRDVVRAYRLLIEGLIDGRVPAGAVVNVATGRSVSVRQLLEMVSHAAGVRTTPRVDPRLVRANDAPEIVGDATLLRHLTGWTPTIPLERTIADVVAEIAAGS